MQTMLGTIVQDILQMMPVAMCCPYESLFGEKVKTLQTKKAKGPDKKRRKQRRKVPTTVWCGVMWCGVVWCGAVQCGVVWCDVVWCGAVQCSVVWCDVVWCGAVQCSVVWCGVV